MSDVHLGFYLQKPWPAAAVRFRTPNITVCRQLFGPPVTREWGWLGPRPYRWR